MLTYFTSPPGKRLRGETYCLHLLPAAVPFILTGISTERKFYTTTGTPLNKPMPQEATGISATPAANHYPPLEKKDMPEVRQETPTSDNDESSPSLTSDSGKAEDLTRVQGSPVPDLTLGAENAQTQGPKIDAAAVKAAAEASAESLKNTIQPQVDALWDAVKWMEDRMEIIDADRRGELEEAARTAAQNTAKVSLEIAYC